MNRHFIIACLLSLACNVSTGDEGDIGVIEPPEDPVMACLDMHECMAELCEQEILEQWECFNDDQCNVPGVMVSDDELHANRVLSQCVVQNRCNTTTCDLVGVYENQDTVADAAPFCQGGEAEWDIFSEAYRDALAAVLGEDPQANCASLN